MNEHPQDSFVFYRSFREAIAVMMPEDQLATFLAICDYALYGVEPKGFFRVYHVDDNESHYFYQKQVLQANAELLARLVGVQVYGGDAVITADGDAYIVDFNDWPSFSRCLCEAAEAIVKMVR